MQGTYSKKMLVDLDMQANEILNLGLETVSSLPAGSKVGRIVVLDDGESVQAYICVKTGSATAQDDWAPLANGGDLSDYQLQITPERGLSWGTGAGNTEKLGHSNSVTQETVGVGSATAIPIIKYDEYGHISSAITTATVYPPTAGATAGYIWTADGADKVGKWVQPSQSLSTSSTTTVPCEKAVADAIALAVTGLYKIKGSATVAQINGTAESGNIESFTVGDVYNITDAGTITLGSITVLAGDNIVYVQTGEDPATYAWDKLAGTVDVSGFVTLTGAQTVDGKTFTNVVSVNGYVPAQAMAKGVDDSTGSLNTTDDTTVPTSKLVASAIAEKMDKFASAPSQANQVVVTAQNDADTIGYLTSDIGSGTQPIFVDDGVLTASSSTVGSNVKPVFLNSGTITAIGTGTAVGGATQPIYLDTDGTLTAGTAIGTAGYKSADTGTISSSSDDDSVPTSLTVYEALTGGVVTKVGTSDVGSLSTPIFLDDGVPTAVTSIAKSLLPQGTAFIYSATLAGDGTTKSWTLPLPNTDTYADPASVSIRDSTGAEVIAKVVYGSGSVTISMNTAPAVNTNYSVRVIA